MQGSKLKSAVFLYLTGVLVIHGVVFWSVRESVRKGYSDFAIYYCAGTIVQRGLGHQLYDEATQFRIQREFAPDVAIRLGALPYNHPPFEAVLFAPLSGVPYPWAFALWDLANLAMLCTLPFLLRPHLPQLQSYPWPLWVIASLSFFPVFIALLQGQDAILLLFLYALAFVYLKKNRDILAGGWLALGLFKPHLVLPFILLLMVQGRKKVLYGFFSTAAGLALISLAVVGREGLMLYPRYVLHLESTLARGAIVPSDMPNLRGALDVLFHGVPQIVAAILAASLGLLLLTAWECRKVGKENPFDLKFSLAVVATILVSYHAMIYDLSMLMVPVLLLANDLSGKGRFRGYLSVLMMTAVATFFFPPLQLVLALRAQQLALLGWVLLLWWFGVAREIALRTSKNVGMQNVGTAG